MATVQHTYQSEGFPDFMADAGSHCTDAEGRQYLCRGGFDWFEVADAAQSMQYLTTIDTPPEPAPQGGAMCTTRTGPYRVWVTHNPGGETWQWLELATVAPEV
ncbi:hypothetical protein [Stutzerimonas nitrititolerans]|uniref:hypothetical protein n=1 Tax=Stutzerimonas nitrititolerans TaxID=2482751 RepID=UPI00289F736A|nr:hypothetical protein [Stutzerimonas nitrititolerans]